MRPVVHNLTTKPTAYKYSLTFDYSTERWTFNNATVTKFFGIKRPTLKECLDTWVRSAKMSNKQEKRKVDADAVNKIATAVGNRIGDVYRKAGLPLVTQLGPFCSYCEMYLSDKVEVEHVCPKSQYPYFCLAWENFLLSCGPCNGMAAKDSRPSRSTVVADYMSGVEPAAEIDYYNTIRQKYLWADTNADAFVNLLPVLQYWSTTENQWKAVPINRSVRLDQSWVSTNISTRTVMANIYVDDTTMASCKVHVILNGKYTQGDRIVDLCELNSAGNTETISDRRLIQRTEAWFAILEVLDGLQYVQAAGFDKVWASVLNNAKTKGFYSLWVQILKLTKMQDPTAIGGLLVTRFVTETNKAGLFPGTDTSNVPGP